MWTNPQETADVFTFTEEVLNENFIFCAVGAFMRKELTALTFSR